MDAFVGIQQLSTVGNILPTGTPLRIFSVDTYSTVSSSNIVIHNGLVSSTTTTIYVVQPNSNQGVGHNEWHEGLYFPDGVWIDTKAAGTVITVVGYMAVKA